MTNQCKTNFGSQEWLAIFYLRKYFQPTFFKSFYFLLTLSLFLPINSSAQEVNKPTNEQLELAKLPIPVQQGITKTINQTTQNEAEVSLSNPAFKARFTNKGLALSPSQNDLTWTWQLDNINGQVGQSVHPILKENPTQKYIDYNRGNFTERYLFHNSSIEQVFIVQQRPTSGEICIEGSIETIGSFKKQKEGWSWNNGDGGINLGALYVYDATGKEIPASFDVYSNNTAIYIDEVALDKAQFPLTIDPEIGTNDFRISDMASNGNPSYNIVDPVVAYNSTDNNYLVVWDGQNITGSLSNSEFEIYGQLITATGAKSGTAFRISNMGPDGSIAYRARDPAIAYNSTDNNYLVVWYGDDNTGGLVTTEFEIFGQLITAAGAESGTDFRISDMGGTGDTFYDAEDPAIAYNSTDNNYLVVWYGQDNTGALVYNEDEIFGQIITASGAESGIDFRISDMGPDGTSQYEARFPEVAYNSTDNNYLVVWFGDDNTGTLVDEDEEIFGQLITAAGTESGTDFRISNMGPNGSRSYDAAFPSVAYNSTDNNYLVVWYGPDNTGTLVYNEYEIFGQLITAAGAKSGAYFRISNMGPDGNGNYDAYDPSVVYNLADNNYLVSWLGDDNTVPLVEAEYEIFGQVITATGAESGTGFRISDMGPDGDIDYDAYNPRMAYNSADNNYLVVWNGDDNTAPLVDGWYEIFGQLYSTSDCEVNVTVADIGGYIATGEYKASETLTADKTIQNGENVILKGGTTIVLKAGFYAEAGSEVHAYIGPCAEPSTLTGNQEIVERSAIALSNGIQQESLGLTVVPNPFNGQTNLNFRLPTDQMASVILFDQSGRIIKHLLSPQNLTAGNHNIRLFEEGMEAGLYFVVLQTANNRITKQVVKVN